MRRVRGLLRISLSYNILLLFSTDASIYVSFSPSYNLGKLFPMFFYRDRKLSERLALSIGMFTRGEVGAGVIFIALGYSLGGPALVISVLTLVLNLVLTGIFVVWVKKLALRTYAPEEFDAVSTIR